jgi:hypothetical protein
MSWWKSLLKWFVESGAAETVGKAVIKKKFGDKAAEPPKEQA